MSDDEVVASYVPPDDRNRVDLRSVVRRQRLEGEGEQQWLKAFEEMVKKISSIGEQVDTLATEMGTKFANMDNKLNKFNEGDPEVALPPFRIF